MSSVLIGILIGLSAAAWSYSKTSQRTGGNTQSAMTVAGVAGLIGFIIGVSAMSLVNNYLGQ